MTLVELQIASAISVILFTAVLALAFYTARSFAAFTNYIDLDVNSRNALDVMSTEIRQADLVTAATSTSLTLQTTDLSTGATHTLKYVYDPVKKELDRIFDGGQPEVLLTECSLAPSNGTPLLPWTAHLSPWPPASPTCAKWFSLPGSARAEFWAKPPTRKVSSLPK